MSSKTPIRLPPLRVLRVRNPNKTEGGRCITVMNSVLSCWASAGYMGRGCNTVEMALRACMDSAEPPKPKSNTINYHLARFSKRLIQSGKKK